MNRNVAILGASDKPDRFAFKALNLLKQHGYNPVPVSPNVKEIGNISVVSKLGDIQIPIDTLTMYVGEKISSALKIHPAVEKQAYTSLRSHVSGPTELLGHQELIFLLDYLQKFRIWMRETEFYI